LERHVVEQEVDDSYDVVARYGMAVVVVVGKDGNDSVAAVDTVVENDLNAYGD
jgi:hypothetical protein